VKALLEELAKLHYEKNLIFRDACSARVAGPWTPSRKVGSVQLIDAHRKISVAAKPSAVRPA
jgi:hypothetical protein